jgi:hypothetical protein
MAKKRAPGEFPVQPVIDNLSTLQGSTLVKEKNSICKKIFTEKEIFQSLIVIKPAVNLNYRQPNSYLFLLLFSP